MFGHDDNNQDQNQHDITAPVSSVPVPEPVADGSLDNNKPATMDPLTNSGFGGLPTPPASPHLGGPPAEPVDSNGLLGIKQQALQQLSPLVSHLDQTPEEKFRTTMMMIQASDDQSLIKTAYESAQKITDEKARAQALLDIVNEINYFTQQQKSNT